MSSNCSHNCGSCSSNCSSRKPADFLVPPNKHSNIKKVIGIVSGKGGVGKSMVTSTRAVLTNRKGKKTHSHDYVMGPVANDQLYATISMYEKGALSAEAAIIQLKTHTLFNQLSCHTDKAIANIKFLETINVE